MLFLDHPFDGVAIDKTEQRKENDNLHHATQEAQGLRKGLQINCSASSVSSLIQIVINQRVVRSVRKQFQSSDKFRSKFSKTMQTGSDFHAQHKCWHMFVRILQKAGSVGLMVASWIPVAGFPSTSPFSALSTKNSISIVVINSERRDQSLLVHSRI